MNQPDAKTAANYVTCSCQHCGDNIEFDANQLETAENTTVPCPHCKLETIISVPQEKLSLPSEQDSSDVSSENYSHVLRWYRKAAENGDAEYQTELAMALCAGLGVQQDYAEAAEWYRRAAEQGNALAQFNLGTCYWNGHGVEKDHTEAAKWFLKAAEQDDAGAQKVLSECYEQGEGIEQNFIESYKWAKLAAEHNETGAKERCVELASKMSKEQIEKGRNLAEAFEIALDAVSKPKDESYFDLLRRFAEDGDIEAQQFLAHRSESRSETMKWTRKSAEQGSALAQYRLGVAYGVGDGVREDYVEAEVWLRKAAEQGFVPAFYELGLIYYYGLGAPQNYVEAYRYANIAAAKGYEKAKLLREKLLELMSPNQVAYAQRLSTEKENGKFLRQAISSDVRREVWRRDNGQCVKCGSRDKLEYDHIIPVAKGGGNTARNLELLCESCNRSKSASIQ